jgi:uncharacterized protein (TIGR02646 family)
MIRVRRGAEPALVRLRGLHAAQEKVEWGRLDAYRDVANDLWKSQHQKCCYCEMRLRQVHNDVEHFRPKAEANRGVHCSDTHGYWWLAFTWENLLFSCAACNRPPAKGTQFPLAAGSVALREEEPPPGHEVPLLIDPAAEDGLDHIEFRQSVGKQWRAFARNGSIKGEETIRVCQLNRDDLITLYTDHVGTLVLPEASDVLVALAGGSRQDVNQAVWRAQKRLLIAGQALSGLSYDALLHYVPNARLVPFKCRWDRPLNPDGEAPPFLSRGSPRRSAGRGQPAGRALPSRARGRPSVASEAV